MIYLYVKTHSITGLKYFGKTERKDPYKYPGSGVYWKRHLNKYGYLFTTEIVGKFTDAEEAEKFALRFSIDHDIVESPEWANLIVENSRDGKPCGSKGHTFTEEELQRMSKISKQKWSDPQYREKMVDIHLKSWATDFQRKENLRAVLKNRWEDSTYREDHARKMREVWSNPEYKENFSSKMKSRTFSEEHRKNLSRALVGKQKSLSARVALIRKKVPSSVYVASPSFFLYRDFLILKSNNPRRWHLLENNYSHHNLVGVMKYVDNLLKNGG